MKQSFFNISQNYGEGVLLYNTLSTSMVELEKCLYTNLFVEENYQDYPTEIEALYKMGFFVDDSVDENEEQRRIRQTVIDSNSGKIANIIIAPTMECNAHCFYCFENGHRKGTMTRKTADALIEHLTAEWNHRQLGITWFGGEPLLAKDIISYICDGLKKNHVSFSSKIVTNGVLLDDEVIQNVRKWNIEKIQVSVDGIEEDYNKIKNYGAAFPDAFTTVKTNIHNALNSGLKIKIRINFDPEKKERALQTLSYFSKEYAGEEGLKIYFAPIDEEDCVVRNIGNAFEEYDEHPYISLIKYGRQNGLYRGFPDMEDEEGSEHDEHGLLKKLKIYPGVTNCYATCPSVYSVDAEGSIYKCHRLLGRKEYSSGDIFNGMIKNQAYKFFCNTDPTYEECDHCALLPICQGGCKVNALLYHGHEACAPSRAIIKQLILLYKEDMDAMIERR